MTQTEALKLVDALNELLESFEKDGKFCKSSIIRNELYDRLKQTLEESKEALAQPEQERNFCSRCGKRLGSNDWDVHTCTPPQPEQEPASGLTPKGYFVKGWDARGMLEGLKGSDVTDAAMRQYMTEIPDTTPPQRQPLTEEQIVAKALHLSGLGTHPDVLKFARAIEAAHGIKGEA